MPARSTRDPVDNEAARLVARAVGFHVALSVGPGTYDYADAPSLRAAAVEASRLVSRYRNGRDPMIYAVDASGDMVLLTSAARLLGGACGSQD